MRSRNTGVLKKATDSCGPDRDATFRFLTAPTRSPNQRVTEKGQQITPAWMGMGGAPKALDTTKYLTIGAKPDGAEILVTSLSLT